MISQCIQQMAMKILKENPNIANNPNAQSMINVISAPSLSDIAAVTKDGNGDGWGNGNGWWVLIILFAIFGGWVLRLQSKSLCL